MKTIIVTDSEYALIQTLLYTHIEQCEQMKLNNPISPLIPLSEQSKQEAQNLYNKL